MSENSINGEPVSDAQIQEWADEAERGYEVAELVSARHRHSAIPRIGNMSAFTAQDVD
jgi:hypothetical protein